jgi:hypothetical protein
MADIDLDAALDEASGDPHKVTWGGQVFTVQRAQNWPIETFDVLAQGRLADGLALILGDEWDAFWQAKRPTLATSRALLDALGDAEGFDGLGGSSASSPTPNRATRRSKPTSSASTP